MKKICSVICAAAIALSSMGSVGIAAEETGSQIKYNYKFSMESDSEFKMTYGYSGGTMNPRKSYVPGKYGNAMQLTYPGHYIDDPSKRYNGFVIQFKDENVELANESISMLDLMRDTQSISMWVHTPVTVDHSGKGAAANRVVEMSFSATVEWGNVGFSKQIKLPNEGEWEYITIPTSEFRSSEWGAMSKAIQSDSYTALTQVSVIFPYATYFGTSPTEDTLLTPWEEPFIIDEVLFDRSTDEVKAITPPSTGEEAYLENANISGVLVKGVRVEGFDKNAASNNIPVPASYTAEDIKKNVTVEVEAPTVQKTNKQQEIAGATYEINAPQSVPGKGTITVISGNRKVRKSYDVNFIASSGIRPDVNNITSDGGNINVPVTNESESGTAEACAIAAVKDGDGVCTGVYFAGQRSIPAGTTEDFSFNVNAGNESDVDVYIFDNETDCNLLCAPIRIGSGLTAYTKPAGAITECSVSISDTEDAINVKGTVTGKGTVFAVLKNGTGYIGAYTFDTEAGAFDGTIAAGGRTYGKIDIILSCGSTVSRSLYNASPSEVNSCISDYKALGSDAEKAGEWFERYKDIVNINNYLSESLSAVEIADAVAGADKNVSNVSGVRKSVGEELILRLVNKTNSADAIREIYSAYNDIAGFDNSTYYFKKYITDDSALDKVLSAIAENDYGSIGDIRNAFNENSLLVSFGRVNGYGEVGELISSNRDILAKYISYDDLGGLDDTELTGYYKYVAEKGVSSLQSLGTMLYDYTKTLGGTGNKTGGIGSVSGGGSSGGGVSIVAPVTGNAAERNTEAPTRAPEKNAFSDVDSSHWAYDSINGLKELGVIDGRDDGSFGVDDAVTREEFVKMLLGAFGKEPEKAESIFRDVDADAWYAPYVNTAAAMGIVSGIEDDVFGVGEQITRQDMSILIARYLEKEGCDLNSSSDNAFIDDGDIADYARDGVYALKNLGFISGMDDNRFMPLDNATRAQTAKVLYSVYSYMKNRTLTDIDITGDDRYSVLSRKFIALDIIEFVQGADDIVTKGQFAGYVTGFINAKNYGNNDGRIIFDDVTPDNKYYNDIRFLYENGYIDKTGSEYGVNTPITPGEAAVIMCRVMGYDFYAVNNGGSLSAYYDIASRYDIIPNLNKTINDSMSFMDVLEIFDSAATAYMMMNESTNSNVSYTETKITPLYYYHKVLVLDDIVNAAGTRTVDGSAGLGNNGVRVGNMSFNADMPQAFRYLGYRVNAYFTEDDETLKFLEPNKNNEIFTVEENLISDFDGSVLKYYKDENSNAEKRETLPKSINRLYNYNYVLEYDSSDVKSAEEVVFIDSNHDGTYDTVNVINEAIYCINQITPYENTLYDYYNQQPVKLEDMKSVMIFDGDNKLTAMGNIGRYDVLSIIEDKQKENVIIYISRDEIDGTVETTNLMDDKPYVIIDGVEYELTEMLAKQNTTAGYFAVGNGVSILLDRHGRAAYVELDDELSKSSFAYLIRAVSEEPGTDPFLRVYTTDGNIEELKFASRATINGNRMGEEEDLDAIFKSANTDPDTIHQLIRYKLNDKGELQTVKTAQYLDSAELYTTASVFTRAADLTDSYYNATYRNFPGYARLSDDTLVMYVPSSEALMREESYYGIRQIKDMKSDTFDNVEIYNMSKDMVAGIAVIRSDSGGGTQLTYSSPVAAVKKVDRVSVEGEDRYKLTLLYNGAETEYVTAEGVEISRQYRGADGSPVTSVIDKGDLIRFAANSNDEITDYHKVFDFDNKDDAAVVARGNEYPNKNTYLGSEKTMIAFNGNASNPDEDVISGRIWQGKNPYWFTGVQYSTEFGIVQSVSQTSMMIRIYPGTEGSNSTECDRYFNLTNKRVYILEDSRDGVRLGSLNDIIPANLAGEDNASRVIISRHNDVPSVLAIVNRKE